MGWRFPGRMSWRLWKLSEIQHPTKASFYLRAGLPIIVWKESAIAPLVEEKGVGFAINSLKELPGRLASISEEEYAGMLTQTKQMAIAINNGENLKKAIQE